MKLDINKLAHECHETAVEKGWWVDGQERDFNELVCLLHSEVSEAFEEYRSGHPLNEIYYSEDKQGNQKPEGIIIEFADLVIRLADWLGCYKNEIAYRSGKVNFEGIDFPVFCKETHYLVAMLGWDNIIYNLIDCIYYVVDYCEQNQLDIDKAIGIKVAYNKTRPHRHGDKKA